MTFIQTSSSDTAQAQSVPQHHLKAAEHLALASRSHKEAAILLASGERRAAELQVQLACDHVVLAGAHVIEARRNRTPMLGARR